MASSYLRQLVMYARSDSGTFSKVLHTVPTLTEPRKALEVKPVPRGLFRLPRVFAPEDSLVMAWGILMILILSYQVATVPFFLAFEDENTIETLAIDFACTIIYLGDIVMTFNTGFYREGHLVRNRKMILQRYLRSWFFLDVVSTFPYNWLFQSPFDTSTSSSYRASSLIRLIKASRMLRTFRLMRIAKVRQHLSVLQQKMNNTLSVLLAAISLCLMMASIAHWAACGFYYVSQFSEESTTWAFYYRLTDSSSIDKYVTALYWAVTTLTTTGYGDIVPINTSERMYGIFVMILSAGAFSYLIGKIGAIVRQMEHDSSTHKELVMDVTRYLKVAEVPDDVMFRALRYIDYVWETRNKRKVLDKGILDQFSEPLKNEISDHLFGKVLQRIPSICKFERSVISQLALGIEPEIFAQDDLIFESGQNSSLVYFIEKGGVEIYHKETSHTFTVLKPGQHFGEIAFFTGNPRTASARSLFFSELLRLSRCTILELTKVNPSAAYTFQQITDYVRRKDFTALGITCYLCFESTHLAYECPNSKIDLEKEMLHRKWMRKRQTPSTLLTVGTANDSSNFQRRERRIRPEKRYGINNVKSVAGWKRLRGMKYNLSKMVAKVRERVHILQDVQVVSGGRKDDMEYCPLEQHELRMRIDSVDSHVPRPVVHSAIIAEEGESSLGTDQRRFSMLSNSARSYQLIDKFKGLHRSTSRVSNASGSGSPRSLREVGVEE